jgi:hypothetical protein
LAIDRPVAWWIRRPGYYRIDGPASVLIHADSRAAPGLPTATADPGPRAAAGRRPPTRENRLEAVGGSAASWPVPGNAGSTALVRFAELIPLPVGL